MEKHQCGHCKQRDQLEVCTDYLFCLNCGGRTSIATGEALAREPQFLVPSTQVPVV